MKKSVNIDDYVLANRYELPIPEGTTQEELDDIKSELFAIMDELDKHYTMIREMSII